MKDRIITAIVLLFIMPINMVTIILSPALALFGLFARIFISKRSKRYDD